MLAFFSRVFLFALFAVGLCLLAAFFSNESFALTCSDGLINCLPNGNEHWFKKITITMECIFKNFLCMVIKIISLFK